MIARLDIRIPETRIPGISLQYTVDVDLAHSDSMNEILASSHWYWYCTRTTFILIRDFVDANARAL